MLAEKAGCKYAVSLSAETAALHLAVKLCGEKLSGHQKADHGTPEGKKAFCSDMAFDATANPVAYEGGEAVFIDTENGVSNMDLHALEQAFGIYPDVRLVLVAHSYDIPAKIDEIRAICQKHGALIAEDWAEPFGATYKGVQIGMFGTASILSFNGSKIVTGSAGGAQLTDDAGDAKKIRK